MDEALQPPRPAEWDIRPPYCPTCGSLRKADQAQRAEYWIVLKRNVAEMCCHVACRYCVALIRSHDGYDGYKVKSVRDLEWPKMAMRVKVGDKEIEATGFRIGEPDWEALPE